MHIIICLGLKLVLLPKVKEWSIFKEAVKSDEELFG